MLQGHFHLMYSKLAKESQKNKRYFSGIPYAFFNSVFDEADIDEQLNYFKMPFVWYLKEGSTFKKSLIERGFHDVGIYRGMQRGLDKAIPKPEVPVGYTFGKATVDELAEVVFPVFGIEGAIQKPYRDFISTTKNMYHWVVKKGKKPVSAISSFRDGEIVSFWNGATLPEFRCQGLSTALRCFALRDAAAKGSSIGCSYLISDSLAFNLMAKLGYQTKWQFHVLLAP